MEKASREIDDQSLKESMKGKGLGTPATRAGIIEKLITAAEGAFAADSLKPFCGAVFLYGLPYILTDFLGTPATRAGIIEKLITVGYVERRKKNLYPTKQGAMFIQLVRICCSSS